MTIPFQHFCTINGHRVYFPQDERAEKIRQLLWLHLIMFPEYPLGVKYNLMYHVKNYDRYEGWYRFSLYKLFLAWKKDHLQKSIPRDIIRAIFHDEYYFLLEETQTDINLIGVKNGREITGKSKWYHREVTEPKFAIRVWEYSPDITVGGPYKERYMAKEYLYLFT